MSSSTVIPLHRLRRPSEDLPVSLEHIGVAFQELQDFRCCVERIICDLNWSVAESKVIAIPLMPRLPRARESLATLAGVRVSRWPDTRWAVLLHAARDEVESRLLEVSMSITSLVTGETSAVDEVVNFSFECTKLAEAAGKLCRHIANQYPQAVGDL